MNDMQKYDLNLILDDVRRSIEVGNSDRDHCYKIGYMISCLKFLEEYLQQFQDQGTPPDICEVQQSLYEKEKQLATDLFGIKAALDEATKIR